MPPWDAEFAIEPEQATALARRCGPELASTTLRSAGAGWDNTAFVSDGPQPVMFRFPRRAFAVDLLETEQRVLPWLSERLPAPIPVPRWFQPEGPGWPRPFSGYDLLPGTTLCRAGYAECCLHSGGAFGHPHTPPSGASIKSSTVLATLPRVRGESHPKIGWTALAKRLGTFVGTLHGLPVGPGDDVPEAPGDRLSRTDGAKRLPGLLQHVADIVETDWLSPESAAELSARLTSWAEATPWDGRAVWCHGDLYARHVLVENGQLAGIIDWGDVHLGDRAVDLSVAWSLFEPADRAHFFAAYQAARGAGRPDNTDWLDADLRARARFRAAGSAVALAWFGQQTQQPELEWAARRGLAHLCGDDDS